MKTHTQNKKTKEMTYNKTMKPTIKPQPHKKATLTKKNNHHKTIKTNPTTKETTKNETKANTNEQKNNYKTTPTKKQTIHTIRLR